MSRFTTEDDAAILAALDSGVPWVFKRFELYVALGRFSYDQLDKRADELLARRGSGGTP